MVKTRILPHERLISAYFVLTGSHEQGLTPIHSELSVLLVLISSSHEDVKESTSKGFKCLFIPTSGSSAWKELLFSIVSTLNSKHLTLKEIPRSSKHTLKGI